MVKLARYVTMLGIGLSVSAFVGWLLFRESRRHRRAPELTVRSQRSEDHSETSPEIVLPQEVLDEATVAVSQARESGVADDLTRINDIGPRFAAALVTAGISTFEQLAEQDPDELAARLASIVNVRSSRIREKDWIGQARRLASDSA